MILNSTIEAYFMSTEQLVEDGIPGLGGATYLNIYIKLDSGEYLYIQDNIIEIRSLSEAIEPIKADEETMVNSGVL